jgi:hypothetical protein
MALKNSIGSKSSQNTLIKKENHQIGENIAFIDKEHKQKHNKKTGMRDPCF